MTKFVGSQKPSSSPIATDVDVQETPVQANPSGRTMIDGPTVAKDLDQTAANKQLVASFVDDILLNGRMASLRWDPGLGAGARRPVINAPMALRLNAPR